MVEDVNSMLVEDVVLTKQGHHVQQSELVCMEQSWCWERAREKVYSWGRGTGMKVLESLEGSAVVKGENFKFIG